jgi:hypothetical protein
VGSDSDPRIAQASPPIHVLRCRHVTTAAHAGVAHAVPPTLGGPGEVDAFEGFRHRARARAVMLTELLCEGADDLCPIEGR